MPCERCAPPWADSRSAACDASPSGDVAVWLKAARTCDEA